MKWAFFLGILGLGSGYLLHDLVETQKESEGTYGVPALPIDSAYFADYKRSEKGLTLSEFVFLGNAVRGQKKEAFPELIEALDGLEQNDGLGSWPLKKLALIRWYQIEARSCLKWLRENPGACPKGNFEVVTCEVVMEEYQNNPEFAYEEIDKLVLGLGSYPEGANEEDWSYNIGRYSVNLPLRLEYLESLCGLLKHGEFALSPDRFGSRWRTDNRDALIRGILGREDDGEALAREYFREHDEEMLGRLEAAIEERRFQELLSEDWRVLKERVGTGDLRNEGAVKRVILEGWAKEDRDAAIKWFLGSGKPQASALRTLVESGVFGVRKWEGADETLDMSVAIPFLEECDSLNYPTEEAWDFLAKSAIFWEGDTDPFAMILPKLTKESLEERITEVARKFSETHSGWVSVGEMSFQLLEITDYTRDFLERVGIDEMVDEEMRKLNLIEVEKIRNAILGEERGDSEEKS